MDACASHQYNSKHSAGLICITAKVLCFSGRHLEAWNIGRYMPCSTSAHALCCRPHFHLWYTGLVVHKHTPPGDQLVK